jgi:polyisoprenoid-binding protein YceI
MLHTVHGKFKLTETGKALGEIVIDVPSGASGSGMRDRRMQKEILESAKYPGARFTPERVAGKLGQSELDHELTLHFKVVMEDGGYTASAHFAIPYMQWGMKSPSNFKGGYETGVEMSLDAAGKSACATLGFGGDGPIGGDLAFG